MYQKEIFDRNSTTTYVSSADNSSLVYTTRSSSRLAELGLDSELGPAPRQNPAGEGIAGGPADCIAAAESAEPRNRSIHKFEGTIPDSAPDGSMITPTVYRLRHWFAYPSAAFAPAHFYPNAKT